MTLNRESRVVRWAYFMESSIPRRTSLCAIFWRTVLGTPLKVAMCLGGLALVTVGILLVAGLALFHLREAGAIAFLVAVVIVSVRSR